MWGPISASVTHVYEGWSSGTIAMMSNWAAITFIFTTIPTCLYIDKFGLRFVMLLGSGFMAVGTCLRSFAVLFYSPFFTM